MKPLMRPTLACVLFAAACGTTPAERTGPAAADPLPAAAERLVAKLLAEAPALRQKSLAVAPIPAPAGRPTDFSQRLHGTLETALFPRAAARGLKVVDRGNLETLAKEWELGDTLAEEATAKQHGRLVGVDVFLIAKYEPRGKGRLDLRATLVDAESAQVLSAAQTELRTDASLEEALISPLPSTPPAPSAASGQELKVEVWADKSDYRVGEKVRISVRANRDCRLTLIDVGTSGSVTVIYPNHASLDNQAKAGVTYTIPAADAGFDFEIGGPPGRELVRAIASLSPVAELEDLVKQTSAQAPFAGVTRDAAALTRDIHVQAKKAKPGEWAQAVLQLNVR